MLITEVNIMMFIIYVVEKKYAWAQAASGADGGEVIKNCLAQRVAEPGIVRSTYRCINDSLV